MPGTLAFDEQEAHRLEEIEDFEPIHGGLNIKQLSMDTLKEVPENLERKSQGLEKSFKVASHYNSVK